MTLAQPLVLITHDLGIVAQAVADHTMVMYGPAASWKPDRRMPSSTRRRIPIQAGLLAAVPRLDVPQDDSDNQFRAIPRI